MTIPAWAMLRSGSEVSGATTLRSAWKCIGVMSKPGQVESTTPRTLTGLVSWPGYEGKGRDLTSHLEEALEISGKCSSYWHSALEEERRTLTTQLRIIEKGFHPASSPGTDILRAWSLAKTVKWAWNLLVTNPPMLDYIGHLWKVVPDWREGFWVAVRMCHWNVPREADLRCGEAMVINRKFAWSRIRNFTRWKVINLFVSKAGHPMALNRHEGGWQVSELAPTGRIKDWET